MSAFDRLYGVVSGALTGYLLQKSEPYPWEVEPGRHPFGDDCLCHRCVFVRGIRGELAAYAKAEAKAAKRSTVGERYSAGGAVICPDMVLNLPPKGAAARAAAEAFGGGPKAAKKRAK